jgi:ribosomal protein S27E
MSSNQPSLNHFPCPGCGAKMEFSPKLGQLQCLYCGREEAIPEREEQVEERPYEESLQAALQTKTSRLSNTALEVACPSCRARMVFEPPDTAGQCPFCGTSIVTQPQTTDPVFTPEAILPFSIPQKQAQGYIQKWLGNRWFAPNALKKLAQQAGIQGVYLPFWTYDADTVTDYTGQRGEHYYTTETYTTTNSDGEQETRTREVQHTRWYGASGRVGQFFDDVLIPASLQINPGRLDKLEPWNLQKLVPYDPAYIAGFKSQRYQVSLEAGLEKAKEKMASDIRISVCRDIGGDEQRIDQLSTAYNSVTFKHFLLPVWLAAYRFNNRQYQVIVNAQTGEVLGDRPYSVWKITTALITAFTLIIGGVMIFRYYQSSQPSSPGTQFRPSTYRKHNPIRKKVKSHDGWNFSVRSSSRSGKKSRR